ncbi:hypothetical protein JCM10449v2_000278 [Rhodotorula kratochvilovae]
MRYCASGSSAWTFDLAGKSQLALSGGAQSLSFDAEHDVVLALIEYPKQAVHKGGDPNKASSFACRHLV